MARTFVAASNNIISLPSTVPLSTTAVTVSMWINGTSFPAAYNTFWGMEANSAALGFKVYVKSSGKIALYIQSSAYDGTGATTLSTGVWYHTAFTIVSGSASNGYVNGTLDGTIGFTSNLVYTPTPNFKLGDDGTGLSRYWNGGMADAAIWNAELTTSEISALASGVRPYRVRRNALIGYWPLEGTASPEPDVINGNDGTLTGTSGVANPTYGSADIVGAKFGARSFNGSSDQINCGTSFSKPVNAVTVSAWVYPTAFTNAYNAIFNANDGSNYQQMFIKSTGKMAWYVNRGAAANVDPGTISMTTNTWQHVAMTYSIASNAFNGYVNGVLDGGGFPVGGGTFNTTWGTPPLAIGYDSTTAGRNFPGLIADVAYWNVGLSAGEVSALAAGVRPNQIRPSGLIAYLPLDGINFPEPDLTGLANNGILTGTTNASGPPVKLWTRLVSALEPAATGIFLRPDADDTDGTWTNELDGSSLFASVDESSANDADYIKSIVNPPHDICKIRLSDPTSGGVTSPATVRYRYRKVGAGAVINLDVSLLQGSTVIATWSHVSLDVAFITASQVLTGPQFSSITDFNDLFLQFDASTGDSGSFIADTGFISEDSVPYVAEDNVTQYVQE